MQKLTTVAFDKTEIASLVLANATDGEVKIKVPRGEDAAGPSAVIEVGPEGLAAALAAAMEVDAEDLAGMSMSVKKDTVELTY